MFACFYEVTGLIQKQNPCMNMTQTAVSTQSHGLGLDMVSLLYHKDIKAKTKSLAFSKLALWKGRMLLHELQQVLPGV